MRCTKCGSEINEDVTNFTTDFATFVHCKECSKQKNYSTYSGIKEGDFVVMKDSRFNETDPEFYPKVGARGKVLKVEGQQGNEFFKIQWERFSTSEDDIWYATDNEVERIL